MELTDDQERLIEATARVAMRRGGHRFARVTDVCALAHRRRSVLYESFKGIEALRRATAVYASEQVLERALESGVEGVLDFFAASPALGRYLLFDAVAVTPGRVDDTIKTLAFLLCEDAGPQGWMAVAGAARVLQSYMLAGKGWRVRELSRELSDFLLMVRER